MESLVIVPPKRPGADVRIARVGYRVADVEHPRPGHDDRQHCKGGKDQKLAGKAAFKQLRITLQHCS